MKYSKVDQDYLEVDQYRLGRLPIEYLDQLNIEFINRGDKSKQKSIFQFLLQKF